MTLVWVGRKILTGISEPDGIRCGRTLFVETKTAIRIRLEMDRGTASALERQSRILNWAYNRLLEKATKSRDEHRKTGSETARRETWGKYALRNCLPGLKEGHPFLRSVHSSPIKNAALRLEESIAAYSNSRSGKRKGRKTGWPRFRSVKRKYFSLLYDEPGKGFKIDGRELTPTPGRDENGQRRRVSCLLERPLCHFGSPAVRTLRITRVGQEFFAVITVVRRVPDPRSVETVCAIDPNHKNLGWVRGNDGRSIEIENPWFLKPLERRIDDSLSKRDRCQRKQEKRKSKGGVTYWKPSRRWKRLNQVVMNLRRKRREQSQAFLYTIANRLVRDYDHISLGDYTPRGGGLSRGMRRSMNNQSLVARFGQCVDWIALKSGRTSSRWPEYRSTVTCESCHSRTGPSGPDIREWRCSKCQVHHLRDENSAGIGLERTLKKLELPGTGHREVISRCTWRFSGAGVESLPHRASLTAAPVY